MSNLQKLSLRINNFLKIQPGEEFDIMELAQIVSELIDEVQFVQREAQKEAESAYWRAV